MLDLTPTEISFLLRFLDELSEYQGNAGCNDETVMYSEENLAFVQAAEAEGMPDEEPRQHPVGKPIQTMDCVLLDFLRNKIRNRNVIA